MLWTPARTCINILVEVAMKLVMACNWDEALIDVARNHGVAELFGKLHRDPIGGGRASFILPKIDRKRAARYIRRVHDEGIAFNYLLNGTCLGLRELTARGQSELRSLIDWLWDNSVWWFTVSIPFVAAMIKNRYPKAHITVSMMAQVDSVERARYWEAEGAEVVILFDNKDFPLIKALKKQTGLSLEVPGNLSCMNRCAQTFHHGNLASHSSGFGGLGYYSLPVCETICTYMKVMEPRRIIAGQWIRPRDLPLYESLGIDRVKLLDRISPTDQLSRIVSAYAAGRFDGNLAELIPGYRQDRVDSYLHSGRLLTMALAFLRPRTYNVFKALPFARRNKTPAFTINPDSLDGFLEGVLKRDCRHLSCEKCGWCESFAQRAVEFVPGERERYLEGAAENIEELESGAFFRYLQGRK